MLIYLLNLNAGTKLSNLIDKGKLCVIVYKYFPKEQFRKPTFVGNKSRLSMVRLTGFEPTTFRVGV